MVASASCSMVPDSCEDYTFVLIGKLNPCYVFPNVASVFQIFWKSNYNERPAFLTSVCVVHFQTQAVSRSMREM